MTWLIALNHVLSIIADLIRGLRQKKHERIGGDLEKGRQDQITIQKIRRAQNARLSERSRRHNNPDWMHNDDGFKRH